MACGERAVALMRSPRFETPTLRSLDVTKSSAVMVNTGAAAKASSVTPGVAANSSGTFTEAVEASKVASTRADPPVANSPV